MTWDVRTETVELQTLAVGSRFRVGGEGQRTGTLLRLTDLTAIVVYDRRKDERREPIGVSLTTQVIPLP